jgi:hypothetical protein
MATMEAAPGRRGTPMRTVAKTALVWIRAAGGHPTVYFRSG